MRVYNFNAGPAALPQSVLETAAAELLDYHGCGMSVMEMSHRSAEFQDIIDEAERDLRALLAIPESYRVLFMQGGGTGQFAAVPMNLMHHGVADYIVSGTWSKKARQEATKYGTANVIASSEDAGFAFVPDCADLPVDADADYVYLCQNETVNGTRFATLPDTKGKPIVADVSSCFLSEPADITRYGVMYGGVQKNVGPAGVVIAIVRDDLIAEPAFAGTPVILDYKTTAAKGSLYNTPPCWNIYMCGLVFKWLRAQGGLAEIGRRNNEKAALLYDRIDASALFRGIARPDCRSIMNVTFTTGDAELDASFVAQAKAAGLVGVKGHRSVGGLRASIYNAVPLDAVQALVNFMEDFEAAHARAASAEVIGTPSSPSSPSSSSRSSQGSASSI